MILALSREPWKRTLCVNQVCIDLGTMTQQKCCKCHSVTLQSQRYVWLMDKTACERVLDGNKKFTLEIRVPGCMRIVKGLFFFFFLNQVLIRDFLGERVFWFCLCLSKWKKIYCYIHFLTYHYLCIEEQPYFEQLRQWSKYRFAPNIWILVIEQRKPEGSRCPF